MILGRYEKVYEHHPIAAARMMICQDCGGALICLSTADGWDIHCRADAQHQGIVYPHTEHDFEAEEQQRAEAMKIIQADPGTCQLLAGHVRQHIQTLWGG